MNERQLGTNSELEELRGSVREFLAAESTVEFLRRCVREDGGARKENPQALWPKLQSFGVFEIFGEGSELGMSGVAMLAFEAGRVVLPVAVAEALVAGILSLPSNAKATSEPADRLALVAPLYSASWVVKKKSTQSLVSGAAAVVRDAAGANGFLLCSGKLLYRVSASERTVIQEGGGVDLVSSQSSVTFSDAPLQAVAEVGGDRLGLAYLLLSAAEIAGVCSAVIEKTQEYAATRRQFGQAIGNFQAVQHRLADMYMHAQAMDSLVRFAAWSFDHDPSQISLAVLSAHRYVAAHGLSVAEEAIQLHGGIGFTWEHDLHLYLRRVLLLNTLCGPAELGSEQLRVAALAR